MKIRAIILLIFCFMKPCFAETRGSIYTPAQLDKMSTLVFKGTVSKVDTVEKYKKTFPTSAMISEVLKGTLKEKELVFKHKSPGKCVIFEKEFNTPTIGQEGTFYLQDQGGTLVLIGYIKKTELKEIDPVNESNVSGKKSPDKARLEKQRKIQEADPPAVFSGTLRDDTGKPVSNAKITASNAGGFRCGRMKVINVDTTTDAQGKFTLETGFYPVYIKVQSNVGTMGYPQNYYYWGNTIPDALLRQKEHDLVLMRYADVTGKVLDDTTGKPVHEFQVHYVAKMSHAPRNYKSKDGHFLETRVTPGTRSITVMAKGYAPKIIHAVSIQPGSRIDIGVIKMSKGPTLTGRVLSADNAKPVANTEIRFRCPPYSAAVSYPPFELKATTDSEGRFCIDNMPLLPLEPYFTSHEPKLRTATMRIVDMSLAQNGTMDAIFFVKLK